MHNRRRAEMGRMTHAGQTDGGVFFTLLPTDNQTNRGVRELRKEVGGGAARVRSVEQLAKYMAKTASPARDVFKASSSLSRGRSQLYADMKAESQTKRPENIVRTDPRRLHPIPGQRGNPAAPARWHRDIEHHSYERVCYRSLIGLGLPDQEKVDIRW